MVINESFSSTSQTVSYDHAVLDTAQSANRRTDRRNDRSREARCVESRIIDDGQFQYVYDAWNRLIKVRSAGDTDVTIQTAEFFADGRRAKKVVTNAGAYDGTEVYFYDGQRIIETRDGSGNVKKQFIHGTQYIDELIMERIFDKGDFYVHQAERDHGGSVKDWNVIAVTDMRAAGGGIAKITERYVYTPYGEVNVMQAECDQGGSMKGFGDGDEDVDSTDKGTVGTTCNTTPVTGSCRILDLDFDGDYDSTDATKFDSLTQGVARHPGKFASGVDQPFMHQGLQYEAELAQYQNRARQYDPLTRRLASPDPMMYIDGANRFCYSRSNPNNRVDPTGMCTAQTCAEVDWEADGAPYALTTCCLDTDGDPWCVPGAPWCDPCIPVICFGPQFYQLDSCTQGCIELHEIYHYGQGCWRPFDGCGYGCELAGYSFPTLAECEAWKRTYNCLLQNNCQNATMCGKARCWIAKTCNREPPPFSGSFAPDIDDPIAACMDGGYSLPDYVATGCSIGPVPEY